MKGLRDGRGGAVVPSGSTVGPALPSVRDKKEAKEDAFNEAASAGGGRPVIFANSVRSQRRRVKTPNTEPSVSRKFPNCSATETMAVKVEDVSVAPKYTEWEECPRSSERPIVWEGGEKKGRGLFTKKGRMRSHVGTLQHLRETSKGTHDTLNNLKSCLCALVEGSGQAMRIIRVSLHRAHSAAIHPSPHASAISAIHAGAIAPISATIHPTAVHSPHAAHPAKSRVRSIVGRIAPSIARSVSSSSSTAIDAGRRVWGVAVICIIGRGLVHDRVEDARTFGERWSVCFAGTNSSCSITGRWCC